MTARIASGAMRLQQLFGVRDNRMKYEEVDEYLVRAFPDFIIDNTDEGLPYCVAGGFARYLLETYRHSDMETLYRAGEFIEELHADENAKIRELATVGYLEGIQNVWGNNEMDPEQAVQFLGSVSRKWWDRLNRFWRGDVHALQEKDAF